jgi:apolipoprotein N-acyltransferase
MAWFERQAPRQWILPAAAVATLLTIVALYGVWRLHSNVPIAGPRVMVVQSNVAHLPGGAPTVDPKHSVDALLNQLERSLAADRVNLVVLPEAALPPINDEARRELAKSPIGPFLEQTFSRFAAVAREHEVAVLVGGNAVTGWITRGREHIGSEIRNSAYLFQPQAPTTVDRYDKVYLARFSERAPITFGPRWLRAIAAYISANRSSQPLVAGSLRDVRPFQLQWTETNQRSARFITPICLENIDPAVVARMLRNSQRRERKRIDFLANLSNDGWFAALEKHQHLQTTILRCIENRVPMARSSNTGISCYIDSCGRVTNAIEPNTTGFALQTLEFDDRLPFYSRFGDVFPIACIALIAAAVVVKCPLMRLRPKP